MLTCSLLALLAVCKKPSDEAESTVGYPPPPRGETHATFTFAGTPKSEDGGFAGRPAMTLRVPREYVWFANILSKNGSVEQLPLQIELPGPTPWQDRPWLKGKKGTPEYDEFMKTWGGRFIATVGTGSGVGGRHLFLDALNSEGRKQDGGSSSFVADGEFYGLVRYTPLRCYSAKDLEEPYSKAFLESKPTDDPRPEPNCRLNRGSAAYFSPATVTNADEVVFIRCNSVQSDCHASFDLEQQGITTYFGHEKVSRWAEIINSTRALVRSFIVRPIPAPLPASTSR
jgi:hypothetical protein